MDKGLVIATEMDAQYLQMQEDMFKKKLHQFNGESHSIKMFKQACSRLPLSQQNQKLVNKNTYYDKMQESLNKNMQQNVFPHWRKHASLKGWCSMNYPAVQENPLLLKLKPKINLSHKVFSNQEKPLTQKLVNITRPLSNLLVHENETIRNYNKSQTFFPIVNDCQDSKRFRVHSQTKSMADLPLSKTILCNESDKKPTNSIVSIDQLVNTLTLPPKGKKMKKKKHDEDNNDQSQQDQSKIKIVIRKQPNLSGAPEFLPLKYGPPQTCKEASDKTVSWNNCNTISKKFSVGILTTATHLRRAESFTALNPIGKLAPIEPQSLYIGKELDNKTYNRRQVQQLNDIQFQNDEEPEAIRNLRRLQNTVLTQENLKQYLTPATTKLNLENHYWIENSFFSKISLLAPNIKELSLRKMPQVTNVVYAQLFEHLSLLTAVDFCDCTGLYGSALQLMIRKNPLLKQMQLSGCVNAVDDKTVRLIAQLNNLEFLDVSYCKQVTDLGLVNFNGKILPIQSLMVNGLTNTTTLGVGQLIKCCTETLINLEVAQLDQDNFDSEIFATIGLCYSLETLDISGCVNIDDHAFTLLSKIQHQDYDRPSSKFPNLIMAKLGMCNLTDYGLLTFIKMAPNVQHLELNRLNNLSEFSLNLIFKDLKHLKFIDLQGVSACTFQMLDELKEVKPDLVTRRFNFGEAIDDEDNGLRIPRRVIQTVDKDKDKKEKENE